MIKKFGQEVRLEIYSDAGGSNKIFSTEGLRVDFHIKIIPGLNQAKFSIYNLNTTTSHQLVNGDRYVKVFTKLHDRAEQEFEHTFYVNNAMNIKKVPNKVTELYCIDVLRKSFTHKQIQMVVKQPTLPRYCNAIAAKAKFNANFDFSSVPDNILSYIPPNPVATYSGEVMNALTMIGKDYECEVIEKPNNTIKFLYLPLDINQSLSNQNKGPYIKLSTVDMRATPRIGIASMELLSNLDFEIRSGSLLDTSELLTASSLESFDTLTLLNNSVKSSMAGVSIYQVLTAEHKGSNYTDDWSTAAMSLKAFKGTTIPTYGWF